MPKLFYGSVQSDGVKIHYYRTGDEKPPVVLLHGFTDNGLCWNRLALILEPDYDLIMVDARGHGISEAPESGDYSPSQQAKDVEMVIRSLQLDRPVLIGHSMGAQTAAMAAGMFPELIRGVVLEDPPWRDFGPPPPAEEMRQRLEKLRADLETMHHMTLDQLIEKGKRENPEWDDSEWFQWAKSKQQIKVQAAQVIVTPLPAWREVAEKINIPVLLLTGDNELGSIVTPEDAQAAAKMWRKKGQVVHIPGAGHNIRREQFGPFLNAVTHFIAKL